MVHLGASELGHLVHLAAGRPREAITQVLASEDVMPQLLPVGVALGPPSSQSGCRPCGLATVALVNKICVRYL